MNDAKMTPANDWIHYLKETGNWDSYDGECNCYQCKKVVAEFDAWKLKQTHTNLHLEVLKSMGWKRRLHDDLLWMDSDKRMFSEPPPLTLDLMWQAEEMLSPLEHQKFCLFLHKEIMGTMDNFDINGTCNLECISRVAHANAEQRARAFMKVKGIA